MTKQNTAKAAQPATDLRQRAARARDAAGRFIKRSVGQVTDQPQPASLPEASVAERRGDGFPAAAATSHDALRGHPDESGCAVAAAGREPRREQDMGRHETFENAAPIADELLAGTFLRRASDQADLELRKLGQQLDDAIARVRPLHDEWTRLGEATLAAMPARPACLYFRDTDHELYLRMRLTPRRELDGMEVTAEDVAWMRRKSYVREVRRPARPEDGLPADAHTVVEAHSWPEAQARADQIITAWDAWKAECARVRASTEVAEFEAEERAEVVEAEILALADRAAEMPASTAEGLRIKLRASAHYVEEHDADYPAGRLLNSLLRDARSSTPATGIDQHPDAALFALGAQFMAAWVAEEADGDEPEYRVCTRIAEQIVRTPAVTVEGYGIKALLLARLDSDSSGPHNPIEVQGPPDSWWNALHQVHVGAALLGGARQAAGPTSSSVIEGRLPAPGHDLSTLSIVELARLYPVVVRVEEVMGSAENAPCFWNDNSSGFTAEGTIINREAERLSRFISAIAHEMGRRQPADDDEAE